MNIKILITNIILIILENRVVNYHKSVNKKAKIILIKYKKQGLNLNTKKLINLTYLKMKKNKN